MTSTAPRPTAPASAARTLDRQYIGGEWVPAASDGRIHREDPADGTPLLVLPAGADADADAAVAAARAAAPGWAATPAGARADLVRAAADAVAAAADELALLQSREMGRPVDGARGGVMAGVGALRQYAELGPLHRGRSLMGEQDAADLMVHEPHGVALALVPWNDPLAIACQMVGAALAVGNAVILKPSERSSLSALRLAELLAAVGFPPGVVNVVFGDARAGRPLVAHPGVDVVMHTGSVATGREVARVCADRGAHAVLELGGKDPLIVDAGVDPAWAAAQAASGAFANSGQVCVSVERIYVHRDVADAFVAALAREAEALRVGDPRADGVDVGPMVDRAQRSVVESHVADALARGGRVVAGGTAPEGEGAYYPPTVVVVPDDDSLLMREETFGPVAPVRVVDSFDEALCLADGTPYGLAATVLTPDMAHAQRAWRTLRAGTVKINAVWGGAPGGAAHPRGASGHGLGYGPELLDELTRIKVVHLRPAPPAGAA